MKRQNVRVLLASEFSGTRTFLRRVIENENKAVIVAEAENGSRAMNLARTLRPDVAIIDSHLPYVVGIDDLPLSRVAGLDVAQSISSEIPNMRVVLLNKVDDSIAVSPASIKSALLCEESKNRCIPFTLSELSDRVVSPGSLIFANIEPKDEPAPVIGKVPLSDKVLLGGILGVIAGWLMVLTMFLATVGLFVIIAGVAAALFGFAGKKLSTRASKSRVAS